MYARIVDPRAPPLSPPPPTTPPLKKQGVENGEVWVLRVALPSHRQEKSAQRGGGGGRDDENIAKENKVGFTKVLSKFIIFLPLKLLILSLKKNYTKISFSFYSFHS